MGKKVRRLMIISSIVLSLVGCQGMDSSAKVIVPQEAAWTLDESTGLDMPELNYADEEKIIFHGYFGLFVYDLEKEEIVHSLDLEAIGCGYTQGDAYCEVEVSKDGNIVQLHPLIDENMYIYNVVENTLEQAEYSSMEDKFEVVPNENANGNVGYELVQLASGDACYLQSEDNTLGGLYYVAGEKKYKLFK
nr:hypothetical protein [uncultured Cellulosilyticum sp.]